MRDFQTSRGGASPQELVLQLKEGLFGVVDARAGFVVRVLWRGGGGAGFAFVVHDFCGPGYVEAGARGVLQGVK